MSIGKNANHLIILKMLNKNYLSDRVLIAESKGERTAWTLAVINETTNLHLDFNYYFLDFLPRQQLKLYI